MSAAQQPQTANSRRLAITGLGMVSAVGSDVISSCASIRAGISRPSDTYVEVVDEETMDEVPLLGHPVRGVTDGYQGVARYTRLGARALRDLLSYAAVASQPDAFWKKTMLIVCVSKTRNDDLNVLDDLLAFEFPSRVLAAVNIPLPPEQCTVLASGHASTLLACELAFGKLGVGVYDRCIVLAVDSLVDTASIEELGSSGRLKSAESPVGLMPGEAAAAILLETDTAARARGARIEAYVGAISSQVEGNNFLSRHPQFGRALANAVASTACQMKAVGEIYIDLNGEELRAADWSHALVILREKHGAMVGPFVVLAVALGDTGAASGAVAICSAVRSFVRGYAHSSEILVCSSAETGEVATGCIYGA